MLYLHFTHFEELMNDLSRLLTSHSLLQHATLSLVHLMQHLLLSHELLRRYQCTTRMNGQLPRYKLLHLTQQLLVRNDPGDQTVLFHSFLRTQLQILKQNVIGLQWTHQSGKCVARTSFGTNAKLHEWCVERGPVGAKDKIAQWYHRHTNTDTGTIDSQNQNFCKVDQNVDQCLYSIENQSVQLAFNLLMRGIWSQQ